jgi:hypothetical protein
MRNLIESRNALLIIERAAVTFMKMPGMKIDARVGVSGCKKNIVSHITIN